MAQAETRVTKGLSCPLTCYPVRLTPGQELKSHLLEIVQQLNLNGAFVLSCVGSLTKAVLRMADSTTVRPNVFYLHASNRVDLDQEGTLSAGGHLHISLSDSEGHVFGGHVMGDLVVYTTAEVVIGDCGGVVFTREPDIQTGYNELVIQTKEDTA